MNSRSEELRKKAEKRLWKNLELKRAMSSKNSEELIHELLVHQVELEIQNEELRAAQEALERSRDRFAELYDFAPVGYFTVDENGVIVEANLTLARMLGYTRKHILNKPLTLFIRPEYHETFFRHRQNIFSGSGNHAAEILFKRFEGDDFYGKILGYLFHDKVNRTPLCRASLMDFTDEKEARLALDIAHRKIQEKAEELEAANASLSEYAYVVSHDLRAPMRAIRNYISFLKEDLKDRLEDQQQEYLGGLSHAVEEADMLIRDLLAMSRMDSHQDTVDDIFMKEFMDDLIKSIQPPPDVEMILPDRWPTIVAKPVLLRQVFQNLIINGFKFNHSDPRQVELGWRDLGRDYEFFVRDNGIGIDVQYHDQIFRMFGRLHTKEEYEGTGIGLSIVKKAVGKLHGAIEIRSAAGQGTTFYIQLPKKPGEEMLPEDFH